MTEEPFSSSTPEEETTCSFYTYFLSQLLDWSTQLYDVREYSMALDQELIRISNNHIHFRFSTQKRDADEDDADEVDWYPLKVSLGIGDYGMLLVHPCMYDQMTAEQWSTIIFFCAHCLQSHAIHKILELRLGMSLQKAQENLKQLTSQERKVLQAMILGQTAKTIARAMKRSKRTMEAHQNTIYQKLQVASGMDAFIMK